ncbi:DUF6492 family protein [Microbacterium sp. NPDC077663]|uniref:DUF6492 family protein n=1 Tax=Microbacterium sp. NPDC077663 TaxID=3364189 RepID=UPI0037C7CA27
MMAPLTFVTVVFEAEIPLLELQARSMSRYLDPSSVDRILILDNCVLGLSGHSRRRLLREYGALQRRVRFARTTELIDPGATGGWRSQQAAKLAIARRVETPHYVVLDAKNHFTRATRAAEFVDATGRAFGRSHPYTSHPLRGSLVGTLTYLGADSSQIERAVSAFPPTATPFVFDTDTVRALMDDIERRSGLVFAEEFERRKLLEFFLYAGWVETRGPGLPVLRNNLPIPSPTVWPKAASVDGIRAAVAEHRRDDAAVFAVHRQVLAAADPVTRDRIAEAWTTFGLFPDAASAGSFIRRFRRRYLPAIVWTRGIERLRRTLGHGKRAPRLTSPERRSETSAT